MKTIKKVSVSPLPRNEASVIDSLNSGDDQTINAPSIHAVNEGLNGKANSSHTHDDRYYTETETDQLLSGKFDKTGGTLTGDINYTQTLKGIYWKEGNYGDKFKIFPDFAGADDSNKLKIQGAVGDQGTDPDLYDLVTITAKSGNMNVKGNITSNNSAVITMSNFAVITGTITMPEANAGVITGSKDVSYPTGFSSTNCVVLSIMSHNTVHTDWWTTPMQPNSSASLFGTGNVAVSLQPNSIIVRSDKSDDVEPRKDVSFKLVLMKVS